MKTRIHYGNLPKSAFLENWLMGQMEHLGLARLKNAEADIWLNSEGSVDSGGDPQFSIKMRVERPNRKSFFLCKKNHDFFIGFRHSVRTLQKLLRKEKSYEKQHYSNA